MKKLIALVLTLCMLMPLVALAATEGRVTESNISTRSGPSTRYTEPGTFLSYGSWVRVHTKVWDSRNEIWWVQVEFSTGRESYRAYTGAWRLDVDLSSVPVENALTTTTMSYTTCGYAGPGSDYHDYSNITLYRGSSVTLLEVENNWGLVECASSSQGLTRVWVPLDALDHGNWYYGQDTYPDDDWDAGATYLPESDWDVGATYLPGGSGVYNPDPTGSWVTVWVEEGNARSGPGTGYDFVNYVRAGDVLQVLDWQMGNTGKDWYQVRVNSRLCWISSGLVTFNGNSNGTAYLVPIVLEDPFADYQQVNTWLIGRWFRVDPSSAHVREEPHTDTPTVGYVKQNQCYEILDCRIGNTGKVWYKIEVEGEIGWISSGLVTLLD